MIISNNKSLYHSKQDGTDLLLDHVNALSPQLMHTLQHVHHTCGCSLLYQDVQSYECTCSSCSGTVDITQISCTCKLLYISINQLLHVQSYECACSSCSGTVDITQICTRKLLYISINSLLHVQSYERACPGAVDLTFNVTKAITPRVLSFLV